MSEEFEFDPKMKFLIRELAYYTSLSYDINAIIKNIEALAVDDEPYLYEKYSKILTELKEDVLGSQHTIREEIDYLESEFKKKK